MKISSRLLILAGLLSVHVSSFAQDPNFYVFLCFGQSNMEGNARVQPQDTVGIDPRFQVLEAVDCSNLDRTKGNWYTAVPPLSRCRTGLSPADFFGRTMVANLPANVRVGVVNVSVAGCKIELFDKDGYQSYAETAPAWMKNMIAEYGNNPYQHLVDMAKIAQKEGVIKGILLHQGESNPNDTLWTDKVKVVYDNLINDIKLNPEEVPLLAGELVHADQNGACASMNSIIGTLPQKIKNAHVISSAGCEARPDRLHFSTEGYRKLGNRYAAQMLTALGYNAPIVD
jgi:hypothetical protein